MKTLLAVLGRGCMMEYPGGPWAPTRDLDHWELGVKRPEVLSDQNDNDPHSVIGGGELQIEAALWLTAELEPHTVVFAYGNRSAYLKEKNWPSESRVMSQIFLRQTEGIKIPKIDVFDEAAWNVEGSSSFSEIHNILSKAKRELFDEIFFLTVQVHMNRVLVMLAQHLKDPAFEDLRDRWNFEATESVLLRNDRDTYAARINAIFGSQSFVRNLGREYEGSKAMYKGITQTQQADPAKP